MLALEGTAVDEVTVALVVLRVDETDDEDDIDELVAVGMLVEAPVLDDAVVDVDGLDVEKLSPGRLDPIATTLDETIAELDIVDCDTVLELGTTTAELEGDPEL